MRITVEDLIRIYPDYSSEKIKGLFAEQEWIEPKALFSSEVISKEDKIEILPNLLTSKNRLCWAHDCARRALLNQCKKGRDPDIASWEALRAVSNWTRNEIRETELESFKEAAWEASENKKESSSFFAALSIAKAMSSESSADAARDAACSIAEAAIETHCSSIWKEAWNKEREWQLKRLLGYLESQE